MSLIKTVIAALTLAGASLSAQADAVYRFTGTVDSGSQVGALIEGEFTVADVAADFSATLALLGFSMNAFGQVYTLADADVPALAYFEMGSLLGVDFSASATTNPTVRPIVTLMANLFQPPGIDFSYDSTGNGTEGFATLNMERVQAVPEPASAALLLAGLLAAGALRRRR